MALEPGFNQVLRFGQNHIVRRTLVGRFAHHNAILSHKASHVVDMSVSMISVQTVGEHQHITEAEGLAKSLDDILNVLRIIAVLARQAIQRGNAQAVAIDFDGTAFKNVGNARALLIFKDVGNAFGNLVVVFPRRKFCAPGVKDRFRNNGFFPFFQEERTVVADPNVVCLDGKETGRERTVSNGDFFRRRQKILFRNQHIHRLEFADGANQVDIELANHFATFAVPILLIMRKSEPSGSLRFPFSGVSYSRFGHKNFL